MFDFFDALVLFLLMHIICDFYLQPKKWIDAKKAKTYRSIALYKHSLLHGVAMLAPALVLDLEWRSTVCLVAIIAISHFAIDLWKVTTKNSEKFSRFVVDQILHVAVLAAIAFSYG